MYLFVLSYLGTLCFKKYKFLQKIESLSLKYKDSNSPLPICFTEKLLDFKKKERKKKYFSSYSLETIEACS